MQRWVVTYILCNASRSFQNTLRMKVYGADWCGDCRRTKALLSKHGIEYEYIDLVAHPDQKIVAEKLSGRRNIPVVVFNNGDISVEPTDEEVMEKLSM